MPSKIRLQRISERIREELSSMLLTQVSDPRLSGVFVNDVKVDRELAYADIYVSAVEGRERSKEVIEGLYSAQGFLRRALADRVELRVFPRLRFHWDPTPERADQIERVFAQMHAQDQQNQTVDGEVTEETAEDAEAATEADAEEMDNAALDDFSTAEDLMAADDLPEDEGDSEKANDE